MDFLFFGVQIPPIQFFGAQLLIGAMNPDHRCRGTEATEAARPPTLGADASVRLGRLQERWIAEQCSRPFRLMIHRGPINLISFWRIIDRWLYIGGS